MIGCPVSEPTYRIGRLPIYPILSNDFDYPTIVLTDIQEPIVDPQQFTAKRILLEDTMVDHKQFTDMHWSAMILAATLILMSTTIQVE